MRRFLQAGDHLIGQHRGAACFPVALVDAQLIKPGGDVGFPRAEGFLQAVQALLALASTIYLSLVGRAGFQEIARQNAALSHFAADALAKIPGVSLAFDGPFFNEFALRLPMPAAEVNRRMLERGYWAGFDLGRCCPGRENELLVCVTETKTAADIESFARSLAEVLS